MSALVLLHGFTGDASSWDAVLEALPPLPSPVSLHRPLLLGHGPAPGGARAPATFADEVARLSLLLPEDPDLHLCGYSLGARLALGLLCHEPGRFASATLIGVNAGLAEGPDGLGERALRQQADEGWARLLEHEGLPAFLDAWEAQPLFASQRRLPPPLQEAQRQRRSCHRAAGLAQALRVLGLARMPDYRPFLPLIQAPVHLLSGAEDDKFLRIARALLPRLRRGELTVVPGAGHDLPLEAPATVAAALRQALQSPPPDAYFNTK